MINYIKKANQEFEQNGRSNRFIAMENKIIQNGNPTFMYLFTRYVKGVDVAKLQQAVIEQGDLEVCYYFQQNIKGSDLALFMKKAVELNNTFWVEKLMEIAIEYYLDAHPELAHDSTYKVKTDINKVMQHNNISEILQGFQREPFKSKMNHNNFDINIIIEKARQELQQNGYSKEFKKMEMIAMHSKGSSAGKLFMQYIPSADIKQFERVAMLKGDPFNMFWIATEIPNSNKKLMLTGLEFAKLDYVAVEEEILKKNSRKEELKQALNKTKNGKKIEELIKEYKKITETSDYIAHIDNDYITRIKYMLRKSQVTTRG